MKDEHSWDRIKDAAAAYRDAWIEHDGCPSMAIMVAQRKMREKGIYPTHNEWNSIAQCCRMHPPKR